MGKQAKYSSVTRQHLENGARYTQSYY